MFPYSSSRDTPICQLDIGIGQYSLFLTAQPPCLHIRLYSPKAAADVSFCSVTSVLHRLNVALTLTTVAYHAADPITIHNRHWLSTERRLYRGCFIHLVEYYWICAHLNISIAIGRESQICDCRFSLRMVDFYRRASISVCLFRHYVSNLSENSAWTWLYMVYRVSQPG